jgi:hypothetical protein
VELAAAASCLGLCNLGDRTPRWLRQLLRGDNYRLIQHWRGCREADGVTAVGLDLNIVIEIILCGRRKLDRADSSHDARQQDFGNCPFAQLAPIECGVARRGFGEDDHFEFQALVWSEPNPIIPPLQSSMTAEPLYRQIVVLGP